MTTETGPGAEVKNAQEEAPQQQLDAAAHGPTAAAASPAGRDADPNEKPGAPSDTRNTEPVSGWWLGAVGCGREEGAAEEGDASPLSSARHRVLAAASGLQGAR